ncbi:hypothetical protein BDY21DRAFT_356309 [Lineolata rhizophorae]|uniref:Fatty acid hydroxylase domain-containing protein n=1 Tax=Lineolata rhizophorae TaxID=578093 RepID=A0A6A6NPT5_9PEZI|nr:hypothetical protein BDY21DRAFT_356309 [Lineolata rhizophorae]
MVDSSGTFPLNQVRVGLAFLLVTSILVPSIYQPTLDIIWNGLRYSTVYRWSSFETLWTVFCYAAIELPITVVFMNHPQWRIIKDHEKAGGSQPKRTKPRGMRRPALRGPEIATYIAPLLLMDLTMIKKFADVPLEAMLASGNYDSAMVANSTVSRHRSTFLVPSLHNFTLSSPLQTRRALPEVAPTSRRLALELLISFFIYDAMFFLFHFALHTIPLFRRFHAPHHRHDAQLNPQVTNQLHVAERLGLVLLANFSLNIIGSHVLTRTLFVPVFVWLLVEIHSGLDLPWAYDKIMPEGWGGGARKHLKHHRTGEGGYEPFFTWWDGLLGMV